MLLILVLFPFTISLSPGPNPEGIKRNLVDLLEEGTEVTGIKVSSMKRDKDYLTLTFTPPQDLA